MKEILYPQSPPDWLYTGIRKCSVYHCRIRNRCSLLQHDLFINHLSESPTCLYCRSGTAEDAYHFFFTCSHFNQERNVMLRTLEQFCGQLQLDRLGVLNIDCFLYGNLEFSPEINNSIFHILQHYIMISKRFSSVDTQ